MAHFDGINALIGIIPIPDQYDVNRNAKRINTVFVVDHYMKMSKSAPSKKQRARGPIIPAVGSLIGKPKTITPSYSDIEDTNTIHMPGNYEVLITAEITPGMDVLLNGINIAGAPEYKQMVTGKTRKLTQTERARFCRGVIWWLVNDETCLKDKLQEIGYSAPIVAPTEPIPVTLPEELGAYTNEAITGYPGVDVAHGIMFMPSLNDDVERDDLESLLREELFDDMGSALDSIMLENEYNRGEEIELYDLAYPAIVQNVVRAWTLPYLRCSIVEEVRA